VPATSLLWYCTTYPAVDDCTMFHQCLHYCLQTPLTTKMQWTSLVMSLITTSTSRTRSSGWVQVTATKIWENDVHATGSLKVYDNKCVEVDRLPCYSNNSFQGKYTPTEATLITVLLRFMHTLHINTLNEVSRCSTNIKNIKCTMVIKTVWSENCNESQNCNKTLQYNMHKNLFGTSPAAKF